MLKNNCHRCGNAVQMTSHLDSDDKVTAVSIRCPKCKTPAVSHSSEQKATERWNSLTDNTQGYKK